MQISRILNRLKGNKSIIQYEDSKGYTLITPIGQTSMIVWECTNFADENEVMNAANSFDIDGIKKCSANNSGA